MYMEMENRIVMHKTWVYEYKVESLDEEARRVLRPSD